MTLLIATHNPGKLAEMTKGLQKNNLKIISLKDLGIKDSPQETGETFAENSLLKAKYYAEKAGLPTVADDGGIMIESLDNEPGVISRMWLGREATDEELIDHTLERLRGYTIDKRKAKFETHITFYDPQTKKYFQEVGEVEGYIAEKPNNVRVPGYPFRSLFIYKDLKKYYTDLTEKEHQKLNHRLKALRSLSKKIAGYLLK